MSELITPYQVEGLVAERHEQGFGRFVGTPKTHLSLDDTPNDDNLTRMPYVVGKYVTNNLAELFAAHPLLVEIDVSTYASHVPRNLSTAEARVGDYHDMYPLETIKRTAALAVLVETLGEEKVETIIFGTDDNSRLELWHRVDDTAEDMFAWYSGL